MSFIVWSIIIFVAIIWLWTVLANKTDKREKEKKEKRFKDLIERDRPQVEARALREKIKSYERRLEKRMEEELNRREAVAIQKLEEKELKKIRALTGINYVKTHLSQNQIKNIKEQERAKLEQEKWWEKEFAKIKENPHYQELLMQKEINDYEFLVKRFGRDYAERQIHSRQKGNDPFIIAFNALSEKNLARKKRVEELRENLIQQGYSEEEIRQEIYKLD